MPAGEPIVVDIKNLGTFIDNPPFDTLGLTDRSQNVIVRENELQTRPGINPLGQTFSNERVLGFAPPTRDLNDQAVFVLATSQRWYKLNSAALTFIDISGGVSLTATLMPSVFTYFFQGGHQFYIGVNGTDPTKEFDIQQNTTYANVSTAPIGRTIATIANRLVIGNLTIAAARFPNDLMWSAVANRQSWPAQARNTLPDTADQIVSIKPLGRSAGAILMERSQWIMQSQPGSDASAFSFTLMDQSPGPLGPAAVDVGPGGMQVVYLGEDLNLWSFNGVKAELIFSTQRYLNGRVNFAYRQITSLAYLHAKQEIWVAISLSEDTLPTHILVYSYRTQQVYIQRTSVLNPITAMGLCICELTTVTNNLPNVPTDQLTDIPTNFLGVSSNIEELMAGNQNGVFTWEGTLDDGYGISGDWQFLLPVVPKMNYTFDGVEAIVEPVESFGFGFFVSVQIGSSYDDLTEYQLGSFSPATSLWIARTNTELVGRIVIVRIYGTGFLKIRRLEIYAWPQKVLV